MRRIAELPPDSGALSARCRSSLRCNEAMRGDTIHPAKGCGMRRLQKANRKVMLRLIPSQAFTAVHHGDRSTCRAQNDRGGKLSPCHPHRLFIPPCQLTDAASSPVYRLHLVVSTPARLLVRRTTHCLGSRARMVPSAQHSLVDAIATARATLTIRRHDVQSRRA